MLVTRRRRSPNGRCLLKSVGIVALVDDAFAIDTELVRRSDCRQTIDVDGRLRINVEDLALAACSGQASLIVVLKETVQPST